MRCGARVLGMPSPTLLGEVGRETLVEAFDRHVQSFAEAADEPVGLGSLLAGLAAHGERLADDDTLRAMLAYELGQTSDPVVRARPLDDADRARDCSGRVGDRHTGARRAVIEGEDLQDPAVEVISALPIS